MRINLHIVRNGVTQDSRVLKETATLQKAGLFESVEIAGFEQDGLPEREEVNGCHTWRIRIASRSLPKDLLSQSIKYWEWKYRLVKAYRSAPLSVIHCNDLGPLPIAVTLKRLTGALLVYDAHELETEKLGNQGIRKLWAKHTERRCMKWVDAMITVSPSIVQWYRNQYPGAPVSLVRNVPIKPSKAQSPMNLRAKFHVPENSLLFLYQGGLSRGRGIEHIVATFSTGDLPHHVLFMGEGPMTEEVKTAANRNHNIH